MTQTPEQRSARRKDRIGARRIDRLKDQTARATANEALLPANFDLQKLQNDVAAIVAFFDLRSVLVQIEEAWVFPGWWLGDYWHLKSKQEAAQDRAKALKNATEYSHLTMEELVAKQKRMMDEDQNPK